jgi:hypothetical protein
MVEFEAEQQYKEMEVERVHQKHLAAAEIKARKLLENVELEANMSSQ